MRVKTVKVAGKDITVRELKIKEIGGLVDKIGTGLNGVKDLNSISEVKDFAVNTLKEKIPEVFPELKPEDIDEAYPSELEELIQEFVNANFFGLKQVAMPLLKLGLKI